MPSVRSSQSLSGRYDDRGNLYVDWPVSVMRTPLFAVARRMIAGLAPPPLHEWEPASGDTVFIDWTVARQVERHLRTFWPAFTVEAQANPLYSGTFPQPEALAFFNDDRSLRLYMPIDGGFCATLEERIPAYARRRIEGLPFLPSAYWLHAEYATIVLDAVAANWPTALVTPGIEAGR